MECRTYNEDELINASLDPNYSFLRSTGRMLAMLEDSNVEPLAQPINRSGNTDLHIVTSTE
jgi:hypothetical protein